ncbi:MAG: hypothetical protein K2N30_05060, partial [Clostridia bacterium]|nr:hypothetical protein [Clostridia bacterium]
MSEENKQLPETEVQPAETCETGASADGTVAAEPQSPHKGFLGKVDNFFGITKSVSKFKVEFIAGLTTFMAMVYILLVNPAIFTSTL